MKKVLCISIVSMIFLLFSVTGVQAMPILPYTTYDGVSTFSLLDTDDEGITRWASAAFSIVDGDLQIVLTNLQPDTKTPDRALAGIFFDMDGLLGDPLSVMVSTGSSFVNFIPTYGDDVSGEYGYYTNADVLSDDGYGNSYPQYFISGSSLDPEEGDTGSWEGLGPDDLVGPLYYGPKKPPNGPDFLMVNDDLGNDLNNFALINNSVTILWNGLQRLSSEDLSNLSDIYFVYGTDYAPVPEPATMLLLGSGLIGIAGFGRKKFKK
jgi:hypothetical protein